jgi:hypothetical protein
MIHWRAVDDVPRSSWIVGAATLTIVASSRSMHSAARMTKRISQRRGWDVGMWRSVRLRSAAGLRGGRACANVLPRFPNAVRERCSRRTVFYTNGVRVK